MISRASYLPLTNTWGCGQGRSGAVSVIALAERGALFDPGPCMCAAALSFSYSVAPPRIPACLHCRAAYP